MSENLQRFLWTAYDRLGGLVGYNLLWSALSLPWIAGAYALLQVGFGLGGVGLVGAAVLAGPCCWAHRPRPCSSPRGPLGRGAGTLACGSFGRLAAHFFGALSRWDC